MKENIGPLWGELWLAERHHVTTPMWHIGVTWVWSCVPSQPITARPIVGPKHSTASTAYTPESLDTMGRALIGCCHWATANQSSPHRGPSSFVGDLNTLHELHFCLFFVTELQLKYFKWFKCQPGNCIHSMVCSRFDCWEESYVVVSPLSDESLVIQDYKTTLHFSDREDSTDFPM